MIKIIKVIIARILRNRIKFKGTESQAIKLNHLQAIISSRGKVKLDWYRFKGINMVRCNVCCKPLIEAKYVDPKEHRKMRCNECNGKKKKVKE